ncbi:MAG: hypothetical protein IH961_03260 [Chloroflexi bacterium]|nr:hypothetical protein [Chloroflexota bacterium]
MSERPESELPEPESGDDQDPQESSADEAGHADAPELSIARDAGDSEDVVLESASASARPLSRREIMAEMAEQSRRNKPFVLAGVLIILGLAAIPAYAFINEFVLPPRERAVSVEDRTYTRGDVVDFIRFHQRLSEETGQVFSVGASLFDALQTISENEMAFQGAPGLGVSVTESELDQEVRRLLGYGYATAENLTSELETQIKEAQFTFLNNVSLTEDTYRDIVRKDLFRSKVRDRLAEDVERIQEQVHVFRIILEDFDEDLRNRISQRIKAGENISDLALEYSVDGEVRRNGGDEGWLPRGVIPELDVVFFGVDDAGERLLPIGQISEVVRIPGDNSFGVIYIDEYASARPVDPAPFEILKDRALRDWFEETRLQLEVVLNLDSKIADWVNRQVRSSSVLLTPTPDPADSGQFRLDQFGQFVPATVP